MRQMPAGQFVPGNSILHRIDARAKLLGLLFLMAAVVGTVSVPQYAGMAVLAAVVMGLSGLPYSLAAVPVRRMGIFFIVIFLMNALFYDDMTVFWQWWIFRLSEAGILQGVKVVAHVALILFLANVMLLTTAPMEITGALTSFMKPLRFLRIPTENIALIVSVAIQFIPTLLVEADMMKKAQTARGARFESRKLTERAASFLPLVIPLFLSAFRRADELSVAMEARGYRSGGSRTGKKGRKLSGKDYAAVTLSMAVCLMVYLMKQAG